MARPRDLVTTTVLVSLIALLVAGLIRLLTLITEILLLVLISAILATGISPLVVLLQRIRVGRRQRHIPKTGAILLVYAAILVVVVLMGGIIVTPLVAETRGFLASFPEFLARLEESARVLQERYSWLPDISALVARLPQELAGLSRYFGTAAGVVFRFFGGLVSTVTVLFMTFYMLLEGRQIKQAFLSLFPPTQTARVEGILHRVGLKFGGWVRGQLLLGLIIGVVVGIGTWALGLPYPLLLGLVAGITELIPIIGPIIGAIPAVLLALFQPPWWWFLAVIAFYTGVQQLESNLVVPRVMRMAVGLSPLLTVIALLVGGKLLGIIGVLLSVPVAAALQVVVAEVLQAIREAARPEASPPEAAIPEAPLAGAARPETVVRPAGGDDQAGGT
ncbi:MAG: AI-2E family transporter [Armatimonadota bacterium]|nr:AI-2E family transporter [Armatimonadota bacterium]